MPRRLAQSQVADLNDLCLYSDIMLQCAVVLMNTPGAVGLEATQD